VKIYRAIGEKKNMKTTANRLRRRRKHRKMPENLCSAFGHHHLFAARMPCLCLRVTLIHISTKASARCLSFLAHTHTHTHTFLSFSPPIFPAVHLCGRLCESEKQHFRFRAEQMSTIVGGGLLGASVRSKEHRWDGGKIQNKWKWEYYAIRRGAARKMCHWTCQKST